jgi:hypothetical protein
MLQLARAGPVIKSFELRASSNYEFYAMLLSNKE